MIIVIAGGLSHERDVSLRSGRRVAVELREAGHEVLEVDVDSTLLPLLAKHPNAVALPMLHGGLGENGALREILQLRGVPFVGSTSTASRRTFDKSIATPLIAAAGVATPRQIALPKDIFRDLGAAAVIETLAAEFSFPLVVKPAASGSALGVTMVHDIDELSAALIAAYAFGLRAVIEEYIDGTELGVTVIDEGEGPYALPPVEIHPASGIYDYEARYTAGTTRFVTPARCEDSVLSKIADAAVKAHNALGLRHISRIDMILREGTPVFLEGNVAPGMTETSLAPLAFEAAGRTVASVFESLISQLQCH